MPPSILYSVFLSCFCPSAMLIDTHCHLTMSPLAEQAEEVLARARAAGVQRMILVAVDVADAQAALRLMAGRPDLYLVAGVHPHEAAQCDPAAISALRALVRGDGLTANLKARIVGVGETGLDLHYNFAPPQRQEEAFRMHLALAEEAGLPVVIHARQAEARVCEILAGHPRLTGRVVWHCFSGDTTLARRILDQGGYCSFTGVVTFKNAGAIRASARYVPCDRLLVETDAPYLSPEPVRKTRPNEPALLVHTARFLADLRGESFEDFAAVTTANAVRFFRLSEGTL
jgi:TatD DNase family protein